ncbi:hypothetical protein BATDEDRAFT_17697 [Batrachochytrium dendrobatidis JAM81]|uniref:Protein-lysine N-methyltransferase EFM5 n=2 Tax=Batrachochytrium dendrobatidis TaxID=109871 RepID=F4PAW4_BATDJ|nr:uncharacterized protein BATDEDRAFT_17697 [Batrachochytrium dendrobatidis JAM81]EGF77614.1 hypothetical protein BATDEDRAFT_17697 [Batrachochytrium dendrobatidis JAM81]|eukprot:XP_006681616.1 hypothetical protein BATDEDRAFT_17697 [Batrachochytrium dendrobatidis JAM81]
MLSSAALAALQDFMKDKALAEQKLTSLKEDTVYEIDIVDFIEDWQLSQFWYDVTTRNTLANESIQETFDNARIGCVSSPSVFVTLKKMGLSNRSITVFEFDKRFNVYGDEFVFFDFNEPLTLDEKNGERPLKGMFDFLIIDPPFLSEECLLKTAQTVRWLAKPTCKILICTGKVQTARIKAQLECIETDFLPLHQNGLQNEFRSFINYSSKTLKRKE